MMLHLTAAGLQLLPGAGGLQTLRIVCEYQVPLESAARPAASHIVFADTSYADRIGWREIVVTGDGVARIAISKDRRRRVFTTAPETFPGTLVQIILRDRWVFTLVQLDLMAVIQCVHLVH